MNTLMKSRDDLKIPNLERRGSLATPLATEFSDSRNATPGGLDELGVHQVLLRPGNPIAKKAASARRHRRFDLCLGQLEVFGHQLVRIRRSEFLLRRGHLEEGQKD
jgi:hypothetical protein